MRRNTVLLVAGISTLVQAAVQVAVCALALAQYLCIFDLLVELPLLLYIRILYFHNPTCETRVNIGHAIPGMAEQAFVLMLREPLATSRTLIINMLYLALGAAWLITSLLLIQVGSRGSRSVHARWLWLLVTSLTLVLDICASVAYVTDTFHTRTLSSLVQWAGGTVSGAGGQQVDTSAAAWLMVMLYSRFVLGIFFNVFLVICVLVECGNRSQYDYDQESMKELESSSVAGTTAIPRVSILRRVPTWLSSVSHPARRAPPPPLPAPPAPPSPAPRRRPASSGARTSTPSPPPGAPPPADPDRKLHTVNFPESLLSLPQRLESMIAKQQRRLAGAVVDTAGAARPAAPAAATPAACASQHLLDQTRVDQRGRRGTAVELQAQLPWSYMPPAPHRMRDQLPPDEELPPVPLPDYTLHHTYRKASVHRAGSSVSAQFTHTSRRDLNSSPLPRSHQIMQSDVLY